MGLKEREDQLVDKFSQFKNWEEKYKFIIRLGKDSDGLPDEDKIDDLKVKGCQSQVWLKASLGTGGVINFKADSDALIVKGLTALLMQLYSGLPAQEILQSQPEVFERLGLKDHLSPSRANGLFSMFKQIKFYALAFSHMQPS